MLIYYLEGHTVVAEFIEDNKEECTISIINYYEVLNYDMSTEQKEVVKSFLESFEILHLSKEIVDQALKNRKLKKIKMADNFILSSTQIHQLQLVTNNSKDFDAFMKSMNPFDV